MPDKLCRICWNINGWRKPSGSADETGDSFVAKYGFGHEEWLFNYEWTLQGYKFAFLEPFRKTRHEYEGKTLDAALYTKFKTKKRTYTLLVGIIKRLYFPHLDELASVFSQIKSHCWLDQMRADVLAVEGKPIPLARPKPEHVINVRFRPEDVTRFDPMPMFPSGHIATKTKRYLANNWDGHTLPADSSHEATTKSERDLVRAAQQATTVDPKHARLQNRLYKTLRDRHGSDRVLYEDCCVDLKLRNAEGDEDFYEIKMDTTAKKCIRSALGQLIEYSVYPDARRAMRWIVVGEAPATPDDARYLKHLRKQYSLPIYYACFDWDAADLGELT